MEANGVPLQEVKSSNISHVGYDEANTRLYVRFKSGMTYCYINVPADKHKEFLAADSLGRHFKSSIRDNFKAVKLQQEAA